MEVEILSRETIRPTTPTPPHLRWHRLSALDQLAPQMTVHVVLFYPINDGDQSPPAHREAVLKTSLSRLLTSFYPLAGRLRREGPPPNSTASVECTDEGVPFTVARADIELESVLQDDKRYIKHYDQLVPRDRSQTDFGDPLLHLQLTHFSCASSALGICLSHQVADGSSWALLLKAWSASARFGVIGPQLTPRFTASSIFPPINPPPPIIVLPSHRKLYPRRFLIGARALERLRTATTEEGIGEAVSGIDGEYARRVISGEVRVEGHEEGGSSLVFSGVGGYGYYEADFGWGRPRRLGLVNHDAGELALFVGTASGEGVEVWVMLEEEVMVRFERDPEFVSGAQLPVEPSNEEYVLWGSLPNVDQLSEDDGDEIQIGEDFTGKSQYHEELEGGKESSDEELGGEENTHDEELEYGQNEPTVHEEMEYSGTDSDVSVGDYGGTVLHYDPELPIMEVGSQFSNVEEFRNSLRQHCILHEFGVKYIKNDKFRVTAKCQGVDCPWRIHVSVIYIYIHERLGAANGGCGRDLGRSIAGPSHPTVNVNRTRSSDVMDP
ncbi:Vinorine synthase [Acorus calamus]|uniref:Vinorine synthase n=1 Tax=Acorus calamus TaxID=4465 RepID=A0AAV9CJS4_ACOCL|nr:Vinorine synthase [Acorus calamus]